MKQKNWLDQPTFDVQSDNLINTYPNDTYPSNAHPKDTRLNVGKSNSANEWIELDLPNASIRYLPHFLSTTEADDYFLALKNELLWRQEEITVYGKTHLTPRLQAWYGDPQARYHYSSMSLQPLSWTITLLALKQRCEQAIGARFNSVLGNWYRDGNDSMGMHADDEKELGPTPVIAALSLGEPRALKFRPKTRPKSRLKSRSQIHAEQRAGDTVEKADLPLPHGSLMVMSGLTQSYWQHGINKTKKPIGDRISLTFRHILSANEEC